jgi:hypothetical protein
MKLDIVPPWLINFIARQLVGHGYKLYQKVTPFFIYVYILEGFRGMFLLTCLCSNIKSSTVDLSRFYLFLNASIY